MTTTKRYEVSSSPMPKVMGAAARESRNSAAENEESIACPVCGREFRQRRPWQKYCGERCRNKAKNQRRPVLRLPRSMDGAEMQGNPHSDAWKNAIAYHAGQIIRLLSSRGTSEEKRNTYSEGKESA